MKTLYTRHINRTLLLLLILCLIVSFFGKSQTKTYNQSWAGPGSFTIPCGATTQSITVKIWGAGGGGGGTSTSTLGSGGGSGAYTTMVFPSISAGTVISFNIGAGGAGGAAGNNAGSAGGATTLTIGAITISAGGGGGGQGQGGTDGSGGTSTDGSPTNGTSGSSGNGGTNTASGSGAGGTAASGGGGPGNPGNHPGGGGGGGKGGGGAGSVAGGNGGNGAVQITFTVNHCSNGIQDCSELAIDCGGYCDPCVTSTPVSITTSTITTNLTAVSAGASTACPAGELRYLQGNTVSGGCVTMTPPNFSDNAAAMWSCDPINLDSSFTVTATVTFGNNSLLGDGITFALKSTDKGNRLGSLGGYIGYCNPSTSGTPIGQSLGVEFDTYNSLTTTPYNNGDSGPLTNCNHAQIVRDGDFTSKIGGSTCLKSDGLSVNDNLAHTVCITWDAVANSFKAFLDGREVASTGNIRGYFPSTTDFPNDYRQVYWGFTAGDGKGTNLNNHIICGAKMIIKDASKYTPACYPILLPVGMTFFKAESIDIKTNQLKWQTHAERDNNYFTIEKSNDGVHFEELTKIIGKGNSNEINDYELIDYYPFQEITYYKLSQTDFDGKNNFLGIQYIKTEQNEYTEIQTNPFQKSCKIKVKTEFNSTKIIHICNSMGKKMYSESIDLSKGLNNLELNFTNYSDGVYFISIEDNNKSETFKVIKINK